jgi:hypothetical protein
MTRRFGSRNTIPMHASQQHENDCFGCEETMYMGHLNPINAINLRARRDS